MTIWQPYEPDSQFWAYFIAKPETCPQTGKWHLQAYGQTIGQKKLPTIHKHFAEHEVEAWIKIAQGSVEQNEVYISKEETSAGDVREWGVPIITTQGKRSDIHEFVALAQSGAEDEELLAKHPKEFLKYETGLARIRMVKASRFRRAVRDITVKWYYGVPGAGKSHAAHKEGMVEGYDMALVSNGKVWFQDYRCENTLLIQELSPGDMSGTMLNQLLDKWPYPIDVKGTSTYACWTTVIITSNYHPKDFKRLGLERRVTLTEFTTPYTAPAESQ